VKRNSDNKRSPLDGRIGAHFGGRNSTRRTKLILGLFVVIGTPMFASALAASVTLNNGDAVEFGQGTGLVIACDEEIVTRINEEWYQTDEVFQVSTIELTDLNVAESTVQNSGCGGKVIKIQLLSDLGVPLTIGDSDLTEISVTLPAGGGPDPIPATATSGSTAVFESPTSNDLGTLTVTISEFVHLVASGVFRVMLESESPGV